MQQRSRFELTRGRRVVAALDVGTSKVCCAIVAIDGADTIRLLGFGHQRSRGLKAGMIVDAAAAELAIRAAVGQAERMAGITVETVHAAINCGRLRSQRFCARAATAGGIVSGADMARVIAGAEAFAERDSRVLVQLERSPWRLDATTGIADPRGLAGGSLATDVVAVTVDESPLRNMLSVLEQCYLAVSQLVPAACASALSVTTLEERRLGVLVVDFGSGTTSLAGFADGELCVADSIPVGAQAITYEVGRALGAAPNEAERIKSLYGTLVAASNDFEDIAYARVGAFGGSGEELHHVSRADLRTVISRRIDNAFALIEERLESAGMGHLAEERVVLTGGGSQLAGLDASWAARFGGSVRIGAPLALPGMSPNLVSPAFACVLGLVSDAATPRAADVSRDVANRSGRYLGWVRNLLSGGGV